MKKKNTKVVDINGVKIERGLRVPKSYKVGDRVKILIEEYSSPEIKYGVIVGFADFESYPTVIVAYLSEWEDGGIKYLRIDPRTDRVEIAPCSDDEIRMEKERVLREMNGRIESGRLEVRETKRKRRMLLKMFGRVFEKKGE